MTLSLNQQPANCPPFRGCIFDMDGTLLDTLPDLTALTNEVLEREGCPTRTLDEVRTFVGNGVTALILQALPENTSDEQAKRAFKLFYDLYEEYGINLTRAFEGIDDVLAQLKVRGIKLGVMSNKFELGVQELEQRYFPGVFDSLHGESATIPRKPDPTGLLVCAREMGLAPEECVYFGDSRGDMLASKAAGMYAVGVTWGYQSLEKIQDGKPDAVIHAPHQILEFV